MLIVERVLNESNLFVIQVFKEVFEEMLLFLE